MKKAITRLFSPEFRNRLDAVVSFAALPKAVIAKVVEKFVFQLEAQLSERNVTIELSDEANAWLALEGYDERYGARPLARVIQEHIKKPLAEELLFGKLQNGGTVRVIINKTGGKKKLGFEYFKPKPRPKTATKPASEKTEKAATPKKPAAKRKRPAKKGKGSSSVPKVPLSDK